MEEKMQDNDSNEINQSSSGILRNLMLRLKLIIRLMGDPRVSLPIKLIPLGTLLYLFAFPDLAPGPIDDGAVIWLGTYLFVELCPPAVVQEHMQAIRAENAASEYPGSQSGDEDIVDSEFREVS
jgi:hypothetical protein